MRPSPRPPAWREDGSGSDRGALRQHGGAARRARARPRPPALPPVGGRPRPDRSPATRRPGRPPSRACVRATARRLPGRRPRAAPGCARAPAPNRSSVRPPGPRARRGRRTPPALPARPCSARPRRRRRGAGRPCMARRARRAQLPLEGRASVPREQLVRLSHGGICIGEVLRVPGGRDRLRLAVRAPKDARAGSRRLERQAGDPLPAPRLLGHHRERAAGELDRRLASGRRRVPVDGIDRADEQRRMTCDHAREEEVAR